MTEPPQASTPGLVVEAERSSQLEDGLCVLDVGRDALDAVARGDWVEASLNTSLTGVDALGVVIDPFEALFASGVAWAFEHLDPLPDMLSSVAGDPAVVVAMSGTWANIADRLAETGDLYTHYVDTDLAGCSGPAIGAYRSYAAREVELLRRLDDMARRAAAAVSMAGALVGTVRATVRDLAAEAVAEVLRLALRVMATAGVAAPQVILDIAVTVAHYTALIGDWLRRLASSVARLSELLATVRSSFDEAVVTLRNVRRWAYDTGVAASPPFGGGPAHVAYTTLENAATESQTLDEAPG